MRDNNNQREIEGVAESIIDSYVQAHLSNPDDQEKANAAYEDSKMKTLARYPSQAQESILAMVKHLWPKPEVMAERIKPRTSPPDMAGYV